MVAAAFSSGRFFLTTSSGRTTLLGAGIVLGGVVVVTVVDRHERRALSANEVAASQLFLAHLQQSNETDDVGHHARNLDRYGITIVRNVLQSEDDIEMWKQRVRRHCTTTTTATPTGPLDQHDRHHGGKYYNKTGGATAAAAAVNVNGRLHFHVAPSLPFHQELARLGGEKWEQGRRIRSPPVAEQASGVLSSSSHSLLTRLVRNFFTNTVRVQHYSLTQIQLLNALPAGSSIISTSHQIWHRDNTAPGLTAIIALTSITGNNGPTEIIIGSHQQPSIWSAIVRAICNTSSSGENDDTTAVTDDDLATPVTHHVLACLDQAGDAILYDSRCLHRGRSNDNGDSAVYTDRPVLVLRWDADLTPPPGGGMIPTAIARYGGFVLSLLLYGQAYWKKKLWYKQ
jgi:Phytanoyl-CoA dioxygenase (PhyH)